MLKGWSNSICSIASSYNYYGQNVYAYKPPVTNTKAFIVGGKLFHADSILTTCKRKTQINVRELGSVYIGCLVGSHKSRI